MHRQSLVVEGYHNQVLKRMTWNWMCGLTVKTTNICQMGKLAELRKQWCTQRLPILSYFLLCWFFAEVYVFLVFVVVHIAGVWPYFHPRPLSILRTIEEQDKSVESSEQEYRFRVQQARYHKQCSILLLIVVVRD